LSKDYLAIVAGQKNVTVTQQQ